MAAKLGGAFLRCALGPLSYAAGCIMQNRVSEGLGELAGENLLGGVLRGIGDVAERAGASDAAVKDLLPFARLAQATRTIEERRKPAEEAWRLHAGHLGGLLTGIAELTVDGRTPDAGLCLERLAKKVSQDDELAVPLSALAEALFTYQDMVEAAATGLDDGGALERAFRRRQRMRVARILASLVALAVAMGLVGRWQVGRARVVRAVEDADPCKAFEIASRDLWFASAELDRRAAGRRATCEEERMEAVRVEAEAKRRAEEEEAARREHEARQAACGSLAEHVAQGRLDDDDRRIAGDAADFLDRIAQKAPAADDYGPADPPAMPCADTPAAAALEAAARAVLVAHTAGWIEAPAPSPAVRKALLDARATIADRDKILLTERAERAAKAAVTGGQAGSIGRAAVLCELAKGLGVGGGGSCDAALRLAGSGAVQ